MKRNILFARAVANDGTPDPDLKFIETINLAGDGLYTVDEQEKEYDRLTGKTVPVAGTNPRSEYSFEWEAAGSGALGVAPAYGSILRSCGFAETITATTDVKYTIAESAFETLEAHFYADDMSAKHTVTESMGSLSLSMTAGEIPRFTTNQIGAFNQVIGEATPTIDNVDWSTEAIIAIKDNTSELTIDGVAYCTQELTIDWNQEVNQRDMPNCKSTTIQSAKATGSATIMAKADQYIDVFTKAQSHEGVLLVPFSWIHGVDEGNRVGVASAEVQLTNINIDGDDDGDRTISFDMRFIDTPEITIT